MTTINSLNKQHLCFSTAKFSVRLLAARDQALYRALFCDQHLMQWIGEPLTEEQVKTSFAAALHHNNLVVTKLAQGSRLFLTISEWPAETAVGLLAVTFHIKAGSTTAYSNAYSAAYSAEIGIMLLPAAQHKGLAHAAFAGLCHRLQQLSTVSDIVCNIAGDNLAAKKLVSGLGFVYCTQSNYYTLRQ